MASARSLHERIDRPNLLVKVPGDRGRGARHPPADQRGPQHQRHPHLRPGPLRRGHGGLPLGAGDLRGDRRHRPLGRPQRRLLLREPGRHRGRPAPGGAGRRVRWRPGAPGPAGTGRRGPGPGGLPALPGHLLGLALGGAGGQGGAGAAAAVGVHVHQEPRLPRPPLRRHPHRAGHGQHHARPDDRRPARPRHRRPDPRRRPPGRRRRPGRAQPRSASTSTTWPPPWRTRACTPSPSPSTSCSKSSSTRPNRSAERPGSRERGVG